ncbi:MAG: exodeoxyribonuclease V subunit beta, partial [Desulforhabdus sp.]|nr:exodeoxyribonuclease V subunit beta [Desulforhabdus sp.]
MSAIQEFDLLHSPLERSNLIEASAGTGKTYTITALYVRLLLEKKLSVERILVVTFTEAATGELRERIRDKLKDAVDTLSGRKNDDALLNALAAQYSHSQLAVEWLKSAIRDFDQAAIFTIHGFCRRILHESAFESGSLFDTELITDQQEFKREIVEDFWRKSFYRTSPLFFHYAAGRNVSPASLLSSLGNRLGQPLLKVIPAPEIPDTTHAEKAFRDCFAELASAWAGVKDEIAEIFSSHAGLNRTQYKIANISAWLQAMEGYLSADGIEPELCADFEKFTANKISKAMRKGHSPPEHRFFQLCEQLSNAQRELAALFEQRLLGLKSALFAFAKKELGSRKRDKNVQSFDDLLLNLYSALQQKGGHELAGAVRAKYSAALIDEFQDTDPIQYAIFKQIFDDANSILFLIGDPKQAIYGFRGADIFAYMEAAHSVQSRYTLGKNWRSDPALIAAINAIFSRSKRPFIYDRIPFLPVAAGRLEEQSEALKVNDRIEPPLQLWLVDAGRQSESGKAVSKTEARKAILNGVTGEISRLLSLAAKGQVVIAGKALKASDIAVLVRKNDEARLMQKALSELRIPAVLYSNANLFDSPEAVEMERLLSGIVEPNNEKLLKAALTTEVIGLKGGQLDRLQTEDEADWELWLVKFREYHDRWATGGFIRMFRRLLQELNVLERLMALPDGERRITNVLHLAEVLQQKSAEKKLSMAAMVKWLAEQRDPGSVRLDEHQLRLESDENAVRLVTVHKSKGLEYPIVFCPFTWDGSKIKRTAEPFLFHDESDRMQLTLDLGSPQAEANRAKAEKELLAENIRLLYVALTRARNRCYLVWGRFNEAETSALAYVLHAAEQGGDGNPVGALEERFAQLSDRDLLTELKQLEARAGESILISPLPDGAGEICDVGSAEELRLSCRSFEGKIDRGWRVSSFS